MALLLAASLGVFGAVAWKRWRLLRLARPEARFDRLGERIGRMMRMGVGQQKMTRYPLAGLAHKAIFFGFLVLLLRSLILFARGFVDDPGFGYGLFDAGTLLGNVYSLVKDAYVLLVLAGVGVFGYLRLVAKPGRLTLSAEGVLILGIIATMMIADVAYDAAGRALFHAGSGFSNWEPLGSLLAPLLGSAGDKVKVFVWHAGYWTHVALVLGFLNLLPLSKHFHVITGLPNVFFQDLTPPGRLRPIGDIEGKIERGETLGVRTIGDMTWKGVLDLYSCTECGRCTDQCPASRTGKVLSPKKITVDLRDHLYATGATRGEGVTLADIVPAVVDPEALWACTTCRACELECPLNISYVDKIVDMRRHLVMERGENPASLNGAFQSMERAGNPYAAGAEDRLKWAQGLDVPVLAELPEGAKERVLFWVGCAPAYDARARGIARAMVKLLNHAKVDWCCLGTEECCTGDAARRAGNEFLFQAMAGANIETLKRYGVTKILTVCAHCFNSLGNEYPDFGGEFEVVHHTQFLAGLVRDGRLTPVHRVETSVVYHDACYLGRHNDVYDAPREVLKAVPGVTLVEAGASRDRGMCCGAGGAQMFKEEEHGTQRVSEARTIQLLQSGAKTIASACPFCMRMLTDAISKQGEGAIGQLDVAEVLLRSIEGEPTA